MTSRRSPRPRPGSDVPRNAPRGRGSTGEDRAASPGRGGPRPGPGLPQAGAGALPGWLLEELARVTARNRVPAATQELEEAAMAFVAGRFAKARHHAEEAKGLAPRLPAIREVLGLAAYRVEKWDQALTELRTYRRLSGDTTHLPVEMDVLRALDRPDEVEAAYALLQRLGGRPEALAEGRVVYASFLLDRDEARAAWELTRPASLKADPSEGELRVWFVAARAAARLGDRAGAKRLYKAIVEADPGFPGLDELDVALRG